MGDPLSPVEPLGTTTTPDGLTILLQERVSRTNNVRVRAVFDSEVFVFANTFAGEVLSESTNPLPQQVEAGDVSDEISTNSLKVLGGGKKAARVIQALSFSADAVTPNGDGINDVLQIGYELYRIPSALPIRINVYSLSGRRVASVDIGEQGAGRQSATWNGLDDEGHSLPPGLYVVELAVKAEVETFNAMRPIAVVY